MKNKKGRIALRVLVFLLGAGLLVWFYIPIGWGVLHIGNGIGIAFGVLLMLGAAGYAPLKSQMETSNHAKGFRILRRVLWSVLAFCLAWAAFLTVCIVTVKPAPPENEKGTVVVLGCQIGSAAINARIDRAAYYLKEHPDLAVVASGGMDNMLRETEGDAIKRGLMRRGIAENRIYVEDKSTTTKENIAFSREIIQKNGLEPTMLIVTEQYHEYRAQKIAQRQGVNAYAVPAKTPWYILSASYGRELLALTKFFVFPWAA